MDIVLGEMTLSGDEGYKEDAVITLKVGEKVTITFADTDGEVVVDYNKRALTVTAKPEDPAGRHGIVYEEVWKKKKEEYPHPFGCACPICDPHKPDCDCCTCNWARNHEG